ncbi:hypothetical protein BJI46_01115 [Acinetobacter qingfengensis]|uniref:Uncharacterized protein n=1 Tax=Acinetobacter qingfengensis TaxID=1262585 RepID=A0A1E7RFI0_9GAMM|nr:hypothetical protein BJI46_01115 [Acinetobacter qingfengensis]
MMAIKTLHGFVCVARIKMFLRPLSRKVMAKAFINFVMKLGKGVTITFISYFVYVILVHNRIHD